MAAAVQTLPAAAASPQPAGPKEAQRASGFTLHPNRLHSKKWAEFLERCLATRLDADRFDKFAAIQYRKHPLSSAALADLFLRPPPAHRQVGEIPAAALPVKFCDAPVDPRIPAYLQVLLKLGYVDVLAILLALYRYSTSQAARKEAAAAAAMIDGHGADDAVDAAADENLVMAMGDGAEKTKHGRAGSGGSTKKRGKKSRVPHIAPVLWASSYQNEETLFYRISRAVRQDGAIRGRRSALLITACVASWMELFVAASSSFAAAAALEVSGMAAPSPKQAEMEATRAAFVMLLLAVCENQTVVEALSEQWRFTRAVRGTLSARLGSFIPLISLSSSAVAGRLEHFQAETLARLEPAEKKKPEDEANDIHDLLDSTVGLQNLVIPEIPITNSRAGLYIYLNAALVGRPLVDDASIFNYLHNRYQGDLQTTAIDLILASFDVLANAVFRSEVQTSAHLVRSYLINKVPLLLASLAASPLYPFAAQYCISEALSRVDTNAFPTMSSMFDANRSATTFTDSVRQDFCFACCLHGLIPEASIETLLGDLTYQRLPDGGRYTKEQLVQQCLGDADQMLALVGQLDNMDGNVGAVSQALVAMLQHLCRTRETSTLKLLCNHLVRNPLAFDVILLFERPSSILFPLAQLLDNWRYDEDQAEYQPVYEEFGATLFLLLAFVYRYNMSIADLGIQWSDASFVATILSTGHVGRTLVELSRQESDNLGNWIRGLFDTDAGGLSDDLMSSCPPQEFYMLTPTLFHQIVQASTSGALPEDVLKGGIEYLVDTFLLPSLVTALMYLANTLPTERPAEQKVIVRVLRLVLQPASISNEATVMLSALLNIVAKPLQHALLTYERLDSRNEDAGVLLKALKQNIPRSRRTAAAERSELATWTGTVLGGSGPGTQGGGKDDLSGGLYLAIRHTVRGFVQWSLHPGVNIMPTSYTHRQFLAGLGLLGAPRILELLLDEVQRQTQAGSASVAYDVACALICASDISNEPAPEMLYVLVDSGSAADGNGDDEDGNLDGNPNGNHVMAGTMVPATAAVQRRMSLRQMLAFKAEEWKKMQQSHEPADVAIAEAVVRLYRKVEAQMTPPPPPPPPPPADLTSLDVDAAAAAAAAAGLDDAAMDMVVAAAAAASGSGDAMVLDGVDLSGLGSGGAGDGGSGVGVGGAGGDGSVTAGSLGDLGDLGSLGGLGDLGDLGDLNDLGMGGGGGGSVGDGKGSLDLGDQSMFGDMDLLNSWIDL